MSILLTSDWSSNAISEISKSMPEQKARKWELQAGHMFFKHKRAAFHLESINDCYLKMTKSMYATFNCQIIEKNTHSSYSGPLIEILLFHLDGFFEAQRAASDFILNCLATAEIFKSIPSSFEAFYKNKSKNPKCYPCYSPALSIELLDFWTKTGSITKAYRDCFTHFFSFSGPTWQHAMNMKCINGEWKATFYLPDNPQGKSYAALKFDSNLDALTLCKKLHNESDNLVKKLMDTCLSKWNVNNNNNKDFTLTLKNIKLGD